LPETKNKFGSCVEDVLSLIYQSKQKHTKMTTLNTTADQIIEIVKTKEVLVKSTNYVQCIIDDQLCEFQKSYIANKWYEFKQIGKSSAPKEVFLRWI
jgi:predicted metalloendopeptidase